MIDFIKNIPYTIRVGVGGIVGGMFIASMSIPLDWGPLNLFDSLWPALPAIMPIVYFTARWEAILDADKIESGQAIRHTESGIFRVIGVLLCSMGLNAYFWHWSAIITLAIFGLAWYGIVFNYHLNLERKLPAFYLPKKDTDGGSGFDHVFNNLKHGGELLALVELLIMATAGYVYIKQI